MKNLKIIFVILICFCLTGCYNYRELNKLGITSAIGVSKKEQDICLSIEVLKTEKGNSETKKEPEYTIFESCGKTVQDALRKTINESSKRLYANHMLLLIIDEKLAKDGIKDIIDLFFRDPEARKQFLVLVSKTNVDELLSTDTTLESINAISIYNRLEANKEYLGNTVIATYSKLLSKYVNPNTEIAIPAIKKEDDKLLIDGTAIFKNDKLVGYLDDSESLYLNLILNNIDDTILTTDGKQPISIEINKSKTKLTNSENTIDINLNLEGNIAEMNKEVDLTDPTSIKDIEEIFEKSLKEKIESTISKVMHEYDTDIFGFKDYLYKKNINKELNCFDINVNVDITLRYKGNGAYKLNER